jgi:hypothetical protein
MAVMATHATTLAPAASGSFGWDERGGANGGDSGDSKKANNEFLHRQGQNR